jgi:EamA domain-containing membrane protein RarD
MTIIISILGAVALLLLWGGYNRWIARDRPKAALMIAAGVILLGNVAIWIWPTADGTTLLDAQPTAQSAGS